MNIIEIYCNKNIQNKKFLENGVSLIMSHDEHIYSETDLKEKKEELMLNLATDFSNKDCNNIYCDECGAPVICYNVDSYNEYYSCVGDEKHSYSIS